MRNGKSLAELYAALPFLGLLIEHRVSVEMESPQIGAHKYDSALAVRAYVEVRRRARVEMVEIAG